MQRRSNSVSDWNAGQSTIIHSTVKHKSSFLASQHSDEEWKKKTRNVWTTKHKAHRSTKNTYIRLVTSAYLIKMPTDLVSNWYIAADPEESRGTTKYVMSLRSVLFGCPFLHSTCVPPRCVNTIATIQCVCSLVSTSHSVFRKFQLDLYYVKTIRWVRLFLSCYLYRGLSDRASGIVITLIT